MTYAQIAADVGIANKSSARKAVLAALASREVEAVEEAPPLSLPAATTTVVPRARASSKTCCEITSQEPEPPRERWSTEAGVALVPGSWPG